MTPEIKSIDEQIKELEKQREILHAAYLASIAKFQIGDVITWVFGNGVRRGRVVGHEEWCAGDPCYVVVGIRADGSNGVALNIYSYHKPELAQEPKSSEVA